MGLPGGLATREWQKFSDSLPDIAETSVADTSTVIWTAAAANQEKIKFIRIKNKHATARAYALLLRSATDATAATTANGIEIDAGEILTLSSVGYDRVTAIRPGGSSAAVVRVEAISIR